MQLLSCMDMVAVGGEIWTSEPRVMSPTYFPPKPFIANGLTSYVTRLVTPPLTVFRCYTCNNCSLKLTDISSDFKDTNITRGTKIGQFFFPQKIWVDKYPVFIWEQCSNKYLQKSIWSFINNFYEWNRSNCLLWGFTFDSLSQVVDFLLLKDLKTVFI